MLRHLAVAAWRNLIANRLQSAIAISGLAIGITAALIMALIIRNQSTFDHFIPGYGRNYLVISKLALAGRPTNWEIWTHPRAASVLKLNAPEVENVARLMEPEPNAQGDALVKMKHGDIAASESIYWADPSTFEVLPQPVLSGDLVNALRKPDGIVLPRATARKYFGREDVVGQTIQIDGHPMTVRAVIEDLPVNGTTLKSGIFASGTAAFSPLTELDKQQGGGGFFISVLTFVRLKPNAAFADLDRRAPALIKKLLGGMNFDGYTMPLVALDQVPLDEGLHPGARTRVAVAGIVGALVLLIAAINFVNLLTARAARRAMEVGLRKACGAARRFLMLQFLGESVLTVFFAACVAIALGEWLMPSANAFLQTGARLDLLNPIMSASLLAGVVALGLLAGAYPAFVLSSFRPASVLKGGLQHSRGAGLVRSGLVVLQFAILIALVVATTVIYQQNAYATREGLRTNVDQVLVTQNGCKPAYRTELRKLPGVAGVSCATFSLMNGILVNNVTFHDRKVLMNQVAMDMGVFAIYGVKPLAGSLPPATEAGDFDPNAAPGVVLNETGSKRLGFATPQAAIGQTIPRNFPPATPPQPGQPPGPPNIKQVPIIAVVPDFTFQALADQPIAATVYSAQPLGGRALVSIKLKGQQIPETLAAIDRIWAKTNPGIPVSRFFVSDHMQELYIAMLRQAQFFAIISGVAIFLACLGLLGLSISTAERRTKEIGIRKAMGAGSGDVAQLLLWQFAKPVLWANLIAWPAAFFVMTSWLNGFAYHVGLNPLVFVGATLLAVIVALLTVAAQSILVARAVPATALRYE